ncbi:hypothetical protein Tco_0816096, partial [Tanacetum coccineum]
VINYTPASLDYSPASETKFDPFEDPSSYYVPPLPGILPFLSFVDDTTDSDTPDTPPSPTHDYFSPDDSARDSSSDSSSKASSDFHSDVSSDSSSRHSLSDHSSPDLQSTSAGPSPKRRRTSMTYVPALPLLFRALSPVRADLIPSPKKGIDARVVVEAVDQEESQTGMRGLVKVIVERVTHPVMLDDIPEPAQEGAVEVTYETLGDLVQRFHDHIEAIPVHRIQRIAELERDNRRLRGTTSVESKIVDQLQRGMSRMQRELRLIRRLRFYNRVRVGRFEIEDLIARRVAEEIEAREATMNLEPLNENGDEQEGRNGNGNGGNEGNGNGGNGGNGNGGNGENGNRGNGGNRN